MDRRKFLSATTAVGTTLVAGCGGSSGDGAAGDGSSTDGEATDGDTSGDGSDGGATASTGAFRLLISDRPADIDDFDSLDVTFDSARVFKAESDEDGDGDEDEDAEAAESASTSTETPETDAETETDTETETETATETETETDTEESDDAAAAESADEDESEDDGEGGFETFDLDSPTVDLTEVVGEKAIGVLDGELETGRYAKIELSVEAVEGVVEGETVPVKVPSNKLQITKPFEITGEGTVEFVFDINVVKKGPNGYNLLPVISESGVAGRDVEVEEVDAASQDTQASTGTETETESDDSEDSDSDDDSEDGDGSGKPDDAGQQSDN